MTVQEAMQAIKANPKSADAWTDLGAALADNGELDKARDCFNRALKFDPNNARAAYGLVLLDTPAEAPEPEPEPEPEQLILPPWLQPSAPPAASPEQSRRTSPAAAHYPASVVEVERSPAGASRNLMLVGGAIVLLVCVTLGSIGAWFRAYGNASPATTTATPIAAQAQSAPTLQAATEAPAATPGAVLLRDPQTSEAVPRLGMFALNNLAAQESGGLRIEVSRVLVGSKEHIEAAFGNPFSEHPAMADKETIGEILFEVSNTTDKVLTVRPRFGTVLIGDEQIALERFVTQRLTTEDKIDGEIFPGINMSGGIWFPIRQGDYEAVNQMTIIFDGPTDEAGQQVGPDFRFDLDLSNHVFEPLAETDSAIRATDVPAISGDCNALMAVYVTEIEPLFDEFQDAINIASSTPRIALAVVIRDMQRIRRDLDDVIAPDCAAEGHGLLVSGMDGAINAFVTFLGDGSDSTMAYHLRQSTNDMDNAFQQFTALAEGRPTPAVPTPTPPPPTPMPRAPGAPIIVGTWQVQVQRVETSTTSQMPYTDSFRKAEGLYVLVYITLTNRGNSPDKFEPPGTLVVKDAEGQEYEVDPIVTVFERAQAGYDLDAYINPDATVNDVAVYDLPPDGKYVLGPGVLVDRYSPGVELPIP
jgi:hypothetical protein